MNQQGLLEEVVAGGEYQVAALGLDVAEQFDERRVVAQVRKQMGQEDQECRQAAEPYPFVEKCAAFFGEEQADHSSEAEEGDGIFFFQPKTRDRTEPEPVARGVFSTGALSGENREVGAAHPQVGFEAVRAQQTSGGKILRCE